MKQSIPPSSLAAAAAAKKAAAARSKSNQKAKNNKPLANGSSQSAKKKQSTPLFTGNFDPLKITTLLDDQNVDVFAEEEDEDDIEEAAAASMPVKASSAVNPDFTFDMGSDSFGYAKALNAWDFTSVAKKSSAAASKVENLLLDAKDSLDDKIERKRKELSTSSATNEDEDDEEGDDQDGDEVETEAMERPAKRTKSNEQEDTADEPEDVVKEKRKAAFFAEPPIPTSDSSSSSSAPQSFTEMRLSRPLLKAITEMGFIKPTTIQAQGIPLALKGMDICGAAVTGSGKTAAFLIPVLERLLFRPKNVPLTRVLVLVPTRELGVQCHSVAASLAKYTDIQLCLCVGGLNSKLQEAELKKRPDIVIATPGRLIDHLHNSPAFNLDSIEILIIDEADRILEDGFSDELNEIIRMTPKSRQSMLFSATMTDNVDDLVKLSLQKPVRLFVHATNTLTSRLVQEFVRVRNDKSCPALLLALCQRTYTNQTIVFFRSKAAAHEMKVIFGLVGLKAAELHGNLTQLQRLEALESFRDQTVDFLLATDLASRGLDISGVKTVINYDMPKSYAQYVHRVGRTARGDKTGKAVSLVGEADRKLVKLALKHSQDEVRHRGVPPEVLARLEKVVDGLKEAVQEILKEEKAEREISVAEMKVAKMENMMKHEDEIKSRPAKVWFQSGKEKAAAKEKGKEKHRTDFGLDAPKKHGKFDGLSRRKKRSKMAKEEIKELSAQKAAARVAKKSSRPNKIPQISKKSGKRGK